MRVFSLFAMLLALPVSGEAAREPATPVAVELFTSQGCSSCPPADALLARLAREPGLIVLTRPVTYWDRLGWKDTLGREANTSLQRAYAARSGSGVYTPQAVVQGMTALVGSNERQLRAAITSAARRQTPYIAVQPAAGGGRNISIDQPVARDAQMMLLALKSQVEVRIGSGENGGRRVTYTNVVLNETALSRIANAPQRWAVSPAQLATRGADRYALIVRTGRAGAILAVRWL